jgi:glycosyltransferase involved in cell wall biosynthesis
MMKWAMGHKWLKKRVYLALVQRRLMNRAASIHCTSPLEFEEMAGLRLAPPTAVIPNGLDVSLFERLPSRGGAREHLGLASGARLSVFVGRLNAVKRLDLTIEAFARVARQIPEAHLALAGPDDGVEASLRRLVLKLDLADKVHFCGLITGHDLYQLYADADLLVLLAASESFAMCVVEAMASGVPVLVAHDVGVAIDVQKASAGCAVKADVGEVSTAWLRMLADPHLRESGRRGRELARRRFDYHVVASEMLDLLSWCVGHKGQHGGGK